MATSVHVALFKVVATCSPRALMNTPSAPLLS